MTPRDCHHLDFCTSTAFSRFAAASVWLSSLISRFGKVVISTKFAPTSWGRALEQESTTHTNLEMKIQIYLLNTF